MGSFISTHKDYSVGDYVMYAGNGICRICDIRSENFNGLGERIYYVMDSVYNAGTKFYLPFSMDGIEKRIRPVLSADDVRGVIDSAEGISSGWIDDEGDRCAVFGEILKSGDMAEVLWLVKILHLHKLKVHKSGHKFRACDEKLLSEAEKQITEEFAFSLGISKERVIPYIVDYIAGKEVGRNDKRRSVRTYRTDTLHNDL